MNAQYIINPKDFDAPYAHPGRRLTEREHCINWDTSRACLVSVVKLTSLIRNGLKIDKLNTNERHYVLKHYSIQNVGFTVNFSGVLSFDEPQFIYNGLSFGTITNEVFNYLIEVEKQLKRVRNTMKARYDGFLTRKYEREAREHDEYIDRIEREREEREREEHTKRELEELERQYAEKKRIQKEERAKQLGITLRLGPRINVQHYVIKQMETTKLNTQINDVCAICLDKPLIKDSCLLICKHNFCIGCVEELGKTQRTKAILTANEKHTMYVPEKQIMCPCCRQNSNMIYVHSICDWTFAE